MCEKTDLLRRLSRFPRLGHYICVGTAIQILYVKRYHLEYNTFFRLRFVRFSTDRRKPWRRDDDDKLYLTTLSAEAGFHNGRAKNINQLLQVK